MVMPVVSASVMLTWERLTLLMVVWEKLMSSKVAFVSLTLTKEESERLTSLTSRRWRVWTSLRTSVVGMATSLGWTLRSSYQFDLVGGLRPSSAITR